MEGQVFQLSSSVHWVAAPAAPGSYFCLVAGAGAPTAGFATAPVRVSAAMLMANSALVRETVGSTGFQLCQVSPPHLLPAATRPDLEAAAELLHHGALLAPSLGALQRAAAVLTSLGVRLVTTITDNTSTDNAITEDSVTDGAATDPSVHQGLLYWNPQAGAVQGPGGGQEGAGEAAGGQQAAGGPAGHGGPGGELGNDPDPLGDWEKTEMDNDGIKMKLEEGGVTHEGSQAILPGKEVEESRVWPTVKAEREVTGGVACSFCPSIHTTDLGLVAHSRKHFPVRRGLTSHQEKLLPCTAGCGSLHSARELASHYRTKHTREHRFRWVRQGWSGIVGRA